jgi:hypothetical protein
MSLFVHHPSVIPPAQRQIDLSGLPSVEPKGHLPLITSHKDRNYITMPGSRHGNLLIA